MNKIQWGIHKNISYDRKYNLNLKDNLKLFFGYRCNNPICQSIINLEFAHIKPTGLNRQGRGSSNRLRDINKNKDSYILLCKECHKKFDNGEL